MGGDRLDLDFGVVGCYTEPHEPKGHRQSLVHIHLGALDLGHDTVGGVETGRAGADDGHAEGPRRGAGGIPAPG